MERSTPNRGSFKNSRDLPTVNRHRRSVPLSEFGATTGPSLHALKFCQGAPTSDRFQATNLKHSLARLGQQQSVAVSMQFRPLQGSECH